MQSARLHVVDHTVCHLAKLIISPASTSPSLSETDFFFRTVRVVQSCLYMKLHIILQAVQRVA